ncbi:MAG: radical SAM protein [Lachnospiraceae bacterium]|nr:radical SAM protein [Lachnospiraceae bacterium]
MQSEISKLILLYIPTSICNNRCEYCFINHTDSWNEEKEKFKYSVDQMLLSLTRERLSGTCLINLTAKGETLLYKDLIPLVEGLLKEGHYVEIITNGSVKKVIDKFLAFPVSYQERLFFKISYHYKEMLGKKKEEDFWENVKRIKESSCSFSLELMPYDSLNECVDNIINQCIKHVGALCHATVGRDDGNKQKTLLTNLSRKDYEKIWGKLDSPMFKLKMDLFGVKRKEFCYAGKWSIIIDLASGKAGQCYGRPFSQNVFEDPSKPIQFFPVGYTCLQPFCFNGHSHVALGMLPDVNAPTYAQIRNRKCNDGSEFLKPKCKDFFSQKIYNNNKQYTSMEKIFITCITPFYLLKTLFFDVKDNKRKLVKYIKIVTKGFIK